MYIANKALGADTATQEVAFNGTSVPFVMTKPQAAKYLQVSERTIDNLRSARVLPYCRVGGSVRFRRTDLDNYLLSTNSHRKVLAA